MGRRVSLPLNQSLFDMGGPPTLASMRKRLGGRVATGAALTTADGVVTVGSIVSIVGIAGGEGRVGVLLAITDEAVDVYVAEGIVKRTRPDLLEVHRGKVPNELAGASESAAIFGRLNEADAVLVERCRYGALVELPDRLILGVGFRKIWPHPRGGAPGN